MSNLLTIIFGLKKNADEAKKKMGEYGSMGSAGGTSKAYKDAQDALDENDDMTKDPAKK